MSQKTHPHLNGPDWRERLQLHPHCSAPCLTCEVDSDSHNDDDDAQDDEGDAE